MDLIEYLDSLVLQGFNSLLEYQSTFRKAKRCELDAFSDKLILILQNLLKIRETIIVEDYYFSSCYLQEKKNQFNDEIDKLTNMYSKLAEEWEAIFNFQKNELEQWLQEQVYPFDWEEIYNTHYKDLNMLIEEIRMKWDNLRKFLNEKKIV